MNPATAQARVIVDELVRNNVRNVVLCPGSRNAPLAFALHEAAVRDRLTLHVRIDERSAGFLALGLAKGLAQHGRPGFAAVVCTSGTAVANLHPAVLEAHHAGVALLVLTADRPVELYGTGANQTVDQRGVFGAAADTMEFPVAERRSGQNAMWRGLVCRAVARAGAHQPVHLNLPFREPLVPDGDDDWPEPLDGRPDGRGWTRISPTWTVRGGSAREAAPPLPLWPRTLLVIGDGDWQAARQAVRVAERAGWPVLVEPTGMTGSTGAKEVLRHGSLLLNSGQLPARLRPDAVVVVGRPTLTRGVQRLLKTTAVVQVVGDPDGGWTDPQHVASTVVARFGPDDVFCSGETGERLTTPAGDAATSGPDFTRLVDPNWLPNWRRADEEAGDVLDALLASHPWPTGLRIARDLVDALPERAVLFLGSSNPVRDVDLVADRRDDLLVYANRGVAGIDGSVSTSVGIALGARLATAGVDRPAGPGYALLGDLTFLHDINGLLIGPHEQRPDLTIVVLNDNGGGIFSLLEQGAPEHEAGFERVFGTPHGADLALLCAGYGVPHTLVTSAAEFHTALLPQPGLRVVEVRTDRGSLRAQHAEVLADVASALHR